MLSPLKARYFLYTSYCLEKEPGIFQSLPSVFGCFDGKILQRIAFADQPHESSFAPASRLQRSIVEGCCGSAVHQEGSPGDKLGMLAHQKLCHIGYLIGRARTACGAFGKHILMMSGSKAPIPSDI